MKRPPTPRQWRVFCAQLGLGAVGFAAALYLAPSWWAVAPLPLAMILPAVAGAGMDTWDERRAARAEYRMWAIKMHPSSWDSYFEIPEREWSE